MSMSYAEEHARSGNRIDINIEQKEEAEMKKGKKVKAVQETACAKAEFNSASAVCSKEENLRKLKKAGKIESFVKKNKGCWNHQSWLVFCAEITEGGYEPIDFDQVGLILEDHKANFFSRI